MHLYWAAALVLLLGAHGFQVPHITNRKSRFTTTTTTRCYSQEEDADAQGYSYGDNDNEAEVNGVGSASLVLTNESKASRLASAFSNLAENDQYDAVLSGLCAKILDDTNQEKAISAQALQDPISLLQEMNDRKVQASGRSLMALIDATTKTQDASIMSNILSLSLKNGGMTQYGALQNTITPMPSMPTSTIVTPDGSRKTRQERLEGLADVPVDDRASEVSSALAFSTVVGFCVASNVLGFQDIQPYTNLLLTVFTVVGVVDNFYGLIQGALKFRNIKVPDAKEVPLGLGTGIVTGTVVRGLTRLLSVDTERECQCEAAAFFAAYSLGLPCYAFRPNALEAAVLVGESIIQITTDKEEKQQQQASLDPLMSNVGIMKMLIWLMAPVAMESSKHAQLIVSDPRESVGFLKRLQERSELFDSSGCLWWMKNEGETSDLLKWAYAEADILLRSNKETVTELTERLAGGAATVGDVVAVMESW